MESWWSARRAFFGLMLLMVAGAALRLPHLHSAYAPDECYSYDEYVQPGLERMLLRRYQCNNQPLSSLATWISTGLLGESDWAMRLPAFLAGMALFPVLYGFTFRASRSRGAALAAVFILCIHLYHIAYSSTFRSYTLVMLFAVLSSWQLLEYLRRPRLWLVGGIGCTVFFMAFSHIVSMILYAGWGLAVVIAHARFLPGGRWKNLNVAWSFLGVGVAFAAAFVLTSIAYSPAFFLPGAIWERLATGVWPPDAIVFVSGAEQSEWLAFDRFTDTVTGLTGRTFWLVSGVAVAGSLLAALRHPAAAFPVLMALGPVAALLLADLKIEPRYSLSLLPFYCAALGIGLWQTAVLVAAKARAWAPGSGPLREALQNGLVLSMLIVLAFPMMRTFWRDYPHAVSDTVCAFSDDAGAVDYLEEHASASDYIAVTPGISAAYGFRADQTLHRMWTAPEAPAADARVWLLESAVAQTPLLAAYHPTASLAATLHGLKIFVLEKPLAGFHEQPLGLNDWTLDPSRAVIEKTPQAGGELWLTFLPGPDAMGIRTKAMPCVEGRLIAAQAWVKWPEERSFVQLEVNMPVGESTALRSYTAQARPGEAEGGWRVLHLSTLPPEGCTEFYLRLSWHGDFEEGDRIGLRAPRVWTDGEAS